MFRCAIIFALAVPPIGIGMGATAQTGSQGRPGAWSVSKAAAQCVIEQAAELPDGSQYRLRGELSPPIDESQLIIDVAANTGRSRPRLDLVWGEHRTPDLVAEKHVGNLYRYRISLPASAMLQPAVGRIAVRARNTDLLAAAIDYSTTDSAAANACWKGLLASWNIDAQAASAIATAPKAADAWLTADDYPAEALASHQEGRVTIIWTARPDLSTGDCKVVEGSGHAGLDKATCDLVLGRIRYVKPALDSAGKPVVWWGRRTFNWLLP